MFPMHEPFEHRWVISKSTSCIVVSICVFIPTTETNTKWSGRAITDFFKKHAGTSGPFVEVYVMHPRTRTWAIEKGNASSKSPFLGSMLVFHGVICRKCFTATISSLALVGPAHLRCQAVCVRLQQGWGPRGSGIWPYCPRLWGCYECP